MVGKRGQMVGKISSLWGKTTNLVGQKRAKEGKMVGKILSFSLVFWPIMLTKFHGLEAFVVTDCTVQLGLTPTLFPLIGHPFGIGEL
jgi:hypothetical protein